MAPKTSSAMIASVSSETGMRNYALVSIERKPPCKKIRTVPRTIFERQDVVTFRPRPITALNAGRVKTPCRGLAGSRIRQDDASCGDQVDRLAIKEWKRYGRSNFAKASS